MDDIISIINFNLPLIKRAQNGFLKNLNLARAYKIAKKYVEFKDPRLFDTVLRFPKICPNIVQYLIYYKNDNMIAQLCQAGLVNFDECTQLFRPILEGNYPKTCEYIAKKVYDKFYYFYKQDYVIPHSIRHGECFYISKPNTRAMAKYFDYLSEKDRKTIVEFMCYHNFGKLLEKLISKYKLDISDICWWAAKYKPNKKISKRISTIRAKIDTLEIIQNGSFMALKHLFKNTQLEKEHLEMNLSIMELRKHPNMCYPILASNEYSLFMFEKLDNKMKFDYSKIAGQALELNSYVLLNSLILQNKLTNENVNRVLSLKIKPFPRFVSLLINYDLQQSAITNLLPKVDNIGVIKVLFENPKINTQENKENLLKNCYYLDRDKLLKVFNSK
jgi:hypothetical protein